VRWQTGVVLTSLSKQGWRAKIEENFRRVSTLSQKKKKKKKKKKNPFNSSFEVEPVPSSLLVDVTMLWESALASSPTTTKSTAGFAMIRQKRKDEMKGLQHAAVML
jgi:hypothetical protein